MLLLSALGAVLLVSTRGKTARGPWIPILLAAVLGGAAALRAESALPRGSGVGAWRPTGGSGGRDFGRVGPRGPSLALERGTVWAREEIAVLGEPGGARFARGPVEGPLRRRGILEAGAERAPDEIVRLSTGRTDLAASLSAPLERVRARLLERAAELSDPLTRGLVAGLLFGDLRNLPPGVGDLFVRTGTFHVLAISGLQVALVAVLLAGPLARILAGLSRAASFGRWRPGFEPWRALILVLFVPVAGAGPPVMRSALAWVVSSISGCCNVRRRFAGDRSMPRTRDPLAVWSLALLCECLVHPGAPLSLSVQLTYAATLGLILATGPLRRQLSRSLPGGARIAATDANGRNRPELLRVVAQRLADASITSVAASLAAVLATMPIVWANFGEWSPAGILATPAIAVAVAWLLVFGWTWLLVPGLVPELLLDLPGDAMLRALEAFDRLEGTPCPLPTRPTLLLVLACGLAFHASISRSHSSLRLSAVAWAALLLPWARAPAGLEIHALDVGHGTGVLLRSPGGSVWILDSGSRDRPEVDREALGPLLRSWDVAHLGVVLTHPDRDHDGALDWLVERYPPALWVGALPARIDARLPHGSPRLDVRRGSLRLPNLDSGWVGVHLDLWRGLDVEGNEGSRSLVVEGRGGSIVLCGDAEAEGLSAWLAASPPRGPARLLLFPHHGSDTDHVARLLAAFQPAEIWISGSGTQPVERELARRGIPTRTTSESGPLSLVLP